jgi:hypothetical protein
MVRILQLSLPPARWEQKTAIDVSRVGQKCRGHFSSPCRKIFAAEMPTDPIRLPLFRADRLAKLDRGVVVADQQGCLLRRPWFWRRLSGLRNSFLKNKRRLSIYV